MADRFNVERVLRASAVRVATIFQGERVLVRIGLDSIHTLQVLSGVGHHQYADLAGAVDQVVAQRVELANLEGRLDAFLDRHGLQNSVDGRALACGDQLDCVFHGALYGAAHALDHGGLTLLGQFLPNIR